MKNMRLASRIIVAIASLSLIATYFLPVWFIFLLAPQYPEGLTMHIWLDKITGEVDIINGLNHYIGMKHIDSSMFPEFSYLGYIVGAFIGLGLVVAISGKRKLLFAFLIINVLAAIAALADFYKWGYDYGHNLDPKAAIQVPGFSYQPPVIGHKQLLNFDAYSYPDTGGWVIIIAGLTFFTVWFLEWRRSKKLKTDTVKSYSTYVSTAVACIVILAGCTAKPEKIAYGKDNCDECRMTIMDPKFGGEIVTKKGRVYKFDDARCLAKYLHDREVSLNDIHATLFTNYNGNEDFLNTKTAVFVVGSEIKSPMGSNAAAFASKTDAEKKSAEVNGKLTDWATLYNIIK
jgi:copper chaperone NosL